MQKVSQEQQAARQAASARLNQKALATQLQQPSSLANVQLKAAADKFGFKVDMKSIEMEAKNIEEAFKKLTQQFEGMEEKMPTNGPSYVR